MGTKTSLPLLTKIDSNVRVDVAKQNKFGTVPILLATILCVLVSRERNGPFGVYNNY